MQLLAGRPVAEILNLTQEEIETTAGQFNTIFFIVFGVLVLMFILSNVIYYVNQRKKKKEVEADEDSDNSDSESIEKSSDETEEIVEINDTDPVEEE